MCSSEMRRMIRAQATCRSSSVRLVRRRPITVSLAGAQQELLALTRKRDQGVPVLQRVFRDDQDVTDLEWRVSLVASSRRPQLVAAVPVDGDAVCGDRLNS